MYESFENGTVVRGESFDGRSEPKRNLAWENLRMRKPEILEMGKVNLTKDVVIAFTINAAFNFVAEFLGTFTLLFLGCASSVVRFNLPGDLTGVALAFGFAAFAGVEMGSQISGGHINPMLTVVNMIFQNISVPMGVVYILAQLCGSVVGFGLVIVVTPGDLVTLAHPEGLCSLTPSPRISLIQAVLTEFITSSVLVLVICAQWDPRNQHVGASSLKVGFTIFVLGYASTFYTGGGMNPARAFGPAIWNNVWTHHWVYWIGPLAAGIFWGLLYAQVFVKVTSKAELKKADTEQT